MIKPAQWTALAFAAIHLLLVLLAARSVLQSPEGPIIWTLFLIADFPASIGLFIVDALLAAAGLNDVSAPTARNLPNFWTPMLYFSLIGSAWWGLLGYALVAVPAYLINRFKRAKPAANA